MVSESHTRPRGRPQSPPTEHPTTRLAGQRLYPQPVAAICMRRATTFRDQDEDGRPVLIISDGVTSVALDSGMSGLSFGVVAASRRLAESVRDFADSVTARWQARDRRSSGRHRRNRRNPGPLPRRGNNAAWRHGGVHNG